MMSPPLICFPWSPHVKSSVMGLLPCIRDCQWHSSHLKGSPLCQPGCEGDQSQIPFFPSAFSDHSWYQLCSFGSPQNIDTMIRTDLLEIRQGSVWTMKEREQEKAGRFFRPWWRSNTHGKREQRKQNEGGRVSDCSSVPEYFGQANDESSNQRRLVEEMHIPQEQPSLLSPERAVTGWDNPTEARAPCRHGAGFRRKAAGTFGP